MSENNYTIKELFEELKKDERLGSDPKERERLANDLYNAVKNL